MPLGQKITELGSHGDVVVGDGAGVLVGGGVEEGVAVGFGVGD